MVIKLRFSRLRRTRWWEYLVRFVFGAVVTVATGAVANEWGPAVAGLFLAFPGIFPAGITLVERHEREKKRERGLEGSRRARVVSGITSVGAVLGSIGLAAFAASAWALLPRLAASQAIGLALLAWLVTAGLAWVARRLM